MYERRLLRLFLVVAVLLAVIAGRAFHLQVLGGDDLLRRKGGVFRSASVVRPIRGEILWADGTPAVRNSSRYAVRVTPEKFYAPRAACGACGHRAVGAAIARPCQECGGAGTWRRLPGPDVGALAACLGVARADLERALAAARRHCEQMRWRTADLFPRSPVPVERAAALALRVQEFPGIDVRGEPWRETDPEIARIAGRTHVAWATDVDRLADPAREDRGLHVHTGEEVRNTLVGSWGLELREDERLRGVPGVVERRPSAPGEPRHEPQVVRPVTDGVPIRTTLVREVQREAEAIVAASAAEACGAVVLDVRDGAVVAAASRAKDPYFRPVVSLIPGSVFKIVPALATLSAGIDPAATLDCAQRGHLRPGVPYTCTGFHPGADLRTAFARSCNHYFMRRAEEVGPAALQEAYERLGLDLDARLGIGVAPGRAVRVSRWDRATAQLGMGQAGALATPLQVATAYGRLAARGRRIVPYVDRDAGPSESAEETDPEIARHADVLLDAARSVVMWGSGVGVPGLVEVEAAGKSGTAEVDVPGGRRVHNAWFVAYAPATAPRYVAVVVHERIDKEHGARLAGPDVARLLRAALRER